MKGQMKEKMYHFRGVPMIRYPCGCCDGTGWNGDFCKPCNGRGYYEEEGSVSLRDRFEGFIAAVYRDLSPQHKEANRFKGEKEAVQAFLDAVCEERGHVWGGHLDPPQEHLCLDCSAECPICGKDT